MRRLALVAVAFVGVSSIAALVGPPARASSGSSAALTFDGSSEYVTFGPATNLDAPAFTVEAWVRWAGGGVGTSTGVGGLSNAIPIVAKGRAEADTPANVNLNYFLGIDASSGVLAADFEDTVNGGNHPVTGTAVVTTNAWHHVAATYDGTTWRLYLDGILDRKAIVGSFTPEATSIEHASIASALNSSGVPAGFFGGSIDEVRIWNVARAGDEIRSTRDAQLDAPAAGLLGRWGLDDGSGTIAADSASGTSGTLVGGPTWVAGYGFPLDTSAPASPVGVTAAGGDTTATVSWTANTETDLAGYAVYRATTPPVPTTGAPINGQDLIAGTTFTDSGLTNGTTYYYALVAVDGANNASTPTEASATPAPNDPPDVTLVAPADGTSGSATAVALEASASDPEGRDVTVTFFGRRYKSGPFAQVATPVTVASGQTASVGWSQLDAGQRYEWYARASDGQKTTTAGPATLSTAAGADPVLVGAGDVASCESTGDEATADILTGVSGPVFTLGDNVYESGLASEYRDCYTPSWGQPSILSRTRPTTGNHDFGDGTNNGDAYFDYFDAAGAMDGPAGPRNTGIYGYDVGASWHVVVLNTECGNAGVGCDAGSPQETWLRDDLAAATVGHKNVIVMMHRPRYSSGLSGGNAGLATFWSDFVEFGVDLVLDGHDHDYERFAPLDAAGNTDATTGVREIIVGTGGVNETGQTSIKPNSVVREFNTFGVLKLTLHATSYDWVFLPVAGASFSDSGSSPVHAGQDHAPAITSVSVTPGRPTTNETLQAQVQASDPDGDVVNLSYQWQRNGVDLAAETSPTLDLSKPGVGDRSDVITVRATASDGIATSEAMMSDALTVANSDPTIDSVSVTPANPATSDNLEAHVQASDADGDPLTVSYEWQRNGVDVAGETGSTLDLSKSGIGDRGDAITVQATASDGTATSDPITSGPVTVADSPPTIASVSIAETSATTASILHASSGSTVDPDGDPVGVSYEWRKNGNDLPGETGPTLDLSKAAVGDRGDVITVRATASDGTTAGNTVESSGITIGNAAPQVTVELSPAQPEENSTVTATASPTDADGDPISLTFEWRRNGVVTRTTSGTTSATDTLDLSQPGNGDPGDTISLTVTPFDGAATGSPDSTSGVVVRDTTPPAAPAPIATVATTSSISLDWPDNAEPDLAGYRVYRASSAAGPFRLVTPTLIATSAYVDQDAVVGDIYYAVAAVDTTGNESAHAAKTISRSIALRSVSTAQSNTTSISVATPAGVSSGDVVLAAVDLAKGGSINTPSGWTQIRNDVNATNVRQALFWRVATSTQPASYSFNLGSSQGATAIAAAYVGVDRSTPVDASSFQAGSSTSIVGPAVSGTENGTLAMFAGVVATTTITPAADLARRAEVASTGKMKVDVELSDMLLSGAGSTGTKIALAATAGPNIGQLVALRASTSPASTVAVPSAPVNPTATAGIGQVTLRWSPPTTDGGAPVTQYRIYRGIAAGGETSLALVTAAQFTDSVVQNGTTYYYRVAAINSVGEGAMSTEASATPVSATSPGAPTGVTATAAKPNGISLKWNAPTSSGGSSITGYQVWRGTAVGGEQLLVSLGNVTSYKDVSTTAGRTYYYFLRAVNGVGASGPSNEVSAVAR